MCRKSGSVYGSKHLQRRPTVYFCCCCDAVNAEGLWKQTQTRKIPTLRARVLGVFSRCYKDAPSFTPLLSVLRSCVKVEMAVLGSASLIRVMVFVDVKQHWTWRPLTTDTTITRKSLSCQGVGCISSGVVKMQQADGLKQLTTPPPESLFRAKVLGVFSGWCKDAASRWP